MMYECTKSAVGTVVASSQNDVTLRVNRQQFDDSTECSRLLSLILYSLHICPSFLHSILIHFHTLLKLNQFRVIIWFAPCSSFCHCASTSSGLQSRSLRLA